MIFSQLVRFDNEATLEDGEPVCSTPSVKPEPQEPMLDVEAFVTAIPVLVEEAEPPPRWVYIWACWECILAKSR